MARARDGCLSENTLDALGRASLAPEEQAAVARHLDGCEDCRELLAALGRALPEATAGGLADGEVVVPAPRSLAAGSRIGRYTVLHVVGAGTMGTVYAAYDPTLDRRVALKLVHHGLGSASARAQAAARLIREAQALARLSHPHVITVYDAGAVDELVFLAMEFIEGGTLREWLRAEARRPAAIVAVFAAAGRGLAALHGAGLVHRDFKPDNVLICRDGRVLVSDFGLARVVSSAEVATTRVEAGGEAPAATSETLTRTDAVLGTPAYMAPELWRGEPADARSDQFAFCVALHEGLQGERPFAAAVLASGADVLPAPRGDRIPAGLQELLARGLRSAPEERHPSMASLVAALERSIAPRRPVWRIAAALVVLVAALAGVIAALAPMKRNSVCSGAGERLRGIWDETQRARIRASFEASGAPFAAAAWASTGALLDRYAASWAAMHTEACEATHVRGEQSGELLDLRMACLGQRRDRLAALVAILVDADRSVVEQGVAAAGRLPALEECASRQALTGPLGLPAEPEARARIEAARVRLAEAAAQLDAGRYEQGRALAQRAVEEATALAYRPLEAEAWMTRAIADVRLELPEQAEPLLHRALVAAEASGHLTIAARAELSLAFVHGVMLRRHAQGRVWAELAGALVERLGEVPALLADQQYVLGVLLAEEGKAGEALPVLERALAIQERALGPEDPKPAATLGRIAAALAVLERFDEALVAVERALALQERLLGPEHPELSKSLHSAAFTLYLAGRVGEAAPLMRRALAIEEGAFGPDHPVLVKTLINLANVSGEPADALALLLRARAIQERSLGALHPDMAVIEQNLAATCGLLERPAEQLAHARAALELQAAILGPEHPELVEILVQIGKAQAALGRPDEALPALTRALALAEARAPGDHYATRAAVREELRALLAEVRDQLERGQGTGRRPARRE